MFKIDNSVIIIIIIICIIIIVCIIMIIVIMYMYIYIYIYMADSPDQRQLKTQKCTNVACELNKSYPINRKRIGVT